MKSSKYLKYAMGEIVLVVIGILIALSINNWNEERKAEAYELLLLQEISNAIENDLKLINDQFIRRTLRKDSAVQALKQMTISKVSVDEQVLLKLIHQTFEGFSQRYTSGPYEALKSNGLDKIRNDELRALLVENYDENLPARMQFIHYFNEQYEQQLTEIKKAMIGNRVIEKEGEAIIEEYIKLPKVLYSPLLFDLLSYQEKIAEHALIRLEDIKGILTKMNEMIKTEITNRY